MRTFNDFSAFAESRQRCHKKVFKATKVDIFCRFGHIVSTGFRNPVHMGFLKLFFRTLAAFEILYPTGFELETPAAFNNRG